MESKRVIAFCSSNQNKVTEFETILRTSFPALLDSTSIVKAHLDLAELQGHPEEISRAKCRLAYEKLKCPVIVEDTSLGFNAFKGLPGPYIKWFLEKLQPQGLADMLKGQDVGRRPFTAGGAALAFSVCVCVCEGRCLSQDRSGFAMTIFSYWDGNPNEGPLVFQGRTDVSGARKQQGVAPVCGHGMEGRIQYARKGLGDVLVLEEG